MFFDDFDLTNNETKEEQDYMILMRKAAEIQRQLFSLRYNFSSHKEIARVVPKKSFFSRTAQPDAYGELLEQLNKCREEIWKNRRKVGVQKGIFWWEIPWEQIEEDLLFDLVDVGDYSNRRFQRKYFVHDCDGEMILILNEEGHISSFSSDSYTSTKTYNNYSQDEIDRRKNALATLQLAYDLSIGSYTGRVESTLTGAEYQSGADYVWSSENIFLHEYAWDQLNNELYTKVETNGVRVTSNSSHYETNYVIASYAADQKGQVTEVHILGNQMIGTRGYVPEDIVEYYESRDGAVMLAAYLSDRGDVTNVPLSLFGGNVKTGSADYNEALRQAKIYTCLAGKL